MKLIIAYVRPERLRDVKTALANAKVTRLAIDNVRVAGDEPGITEHYRGADRYIDTNQRVRFEIAVNDEFVDATLAALKDGGQTEHDSDGVIFVVNMEQAVNISSGVSGGEAIA